MEEISIIGLDLAKNVFQVHGADESGRAVVRKKLRRAQVWCSLPTCRAALLRLKPARVRIIRVARLVVWAMK